MSESENAQTSMPETVKLSDTKRTNVRFTDDELERIKSDSLLAGLSIPQLLKNAYFKKRSLKLLMDAEERKRLFLELSRIGNNINQIARKVNTGEPQNWHSEFKEALNALNILKSLASGIYGLR